MDRRISKSNTNYQLQKYLAESYLKKHSFDEDGWRLASSDPAVSKLIEANSLTLFFENPQTLLSQRRLEHYATTQRLREGVYILFRGKIRVLLSNPARNSSKVDIQHAIHKMESSSKFKCTSSKLNIIETSQTYQVINCTNNCLALANTECWFICYEDLVSHHFYQNHSKLVELLKLNARVFSVSLQLPFVFKLITLTFRNRIDLIDQIELAIIKKGAVRVQWRNNSCQHLIIGQGDVIIKHNDYLYTCESSNTELVGIQANKTFRFIQDPLWTKRPIATPPNPPKERNPNQMLLFRSRSINLQRLTAQSGSRQKYQKSLSVQKEQNRLFTLQSGSSTVNHRDAIKQNWIFMRKIENFQVASNTRSEMQYQRIQALRQRFKKQKLKKKTIEIPPKNETFLMKNKPRAKVKFQKFKNKQHNSSQSHLFHSVNSFFNRQINHITR